MSTTVHVLLLIFIGQCQGFQLDLQWLDEPILKLLEDKMYCQLAIDLPDFDYDACLLKDINSYLSIKLIALQH